MPTLTDKSAFAVAAFAGAASWLAVTAGEGRREAWDSEWYFVFVLPGLAILVTWLGFLAPRAPWRWAIVPFAAQAAVALVMHPTASLFPLGLVVFLTFGAVCVVPAVVGGWFRRWYERQRNEAR